MRRQPGPGIRDDLASTGTRDPPYGRGPRRRARITKFARSGFPLIALGIHRSLGEVLPLRAPLTVPQPCAMERAIRALVSNSPQWGPVSPFFTVLRVP